MLTDLKKHDKWKNLYLIRHGESTCNEVNRFAGMIDAPLTALGEAQARKAAKSWRGDPPDRIYSSPLTRARRTAQILFPPPANGQASEQPTPEFVIDERINERHFGDFTLRNKAFIQRDVGLGNYEAALYGDFAGNSGGEGFGDFERRVRDFLHNELSVQLDQGKKILVVAHKYVIELLCRLILDMPSGEGHDLRLPNASILHASNLRGYVRRESRTWNFVQEWISLNYSLVLMSAVLFGILLQYYELMPDVPTICRLGLLCLSTAISLARVDITSQHQETGDRMICMKNVLTRYGLLPVALAVLNCIVVDQTWLFPLAMLFAAPVAVAGITISRSVGGFVFPVAYSILVSTAVGAAVMVPILASQGMNDLMGLVVWLVIISGATGLIPLAVVCYFRRHHPIGTARFAERNAAWGIILLSVFVTLSFCHVDLDSFYPYGVWALAFGVVLRLTALLFGRRDTLFAVDDYVSMSHPNIFFVILLATAIGADDLLGVATWFLLPMFVLAPVDEWLCRKLAVDSDDFRLLSFLGVPTAGGNALRVRLPPELIPGGLGGYPTRSG